MFHSVDSTIRSMWQSHTLDALKTFVSLPCKSPAFDADWEKHRYLHKAAHDAAQWGSKLFPQAQFEVLEAQGRTPCLFFDIPATNSTSNVSVLFYGHLDKQPETIGWTNGRTAFTPSVEDNRLYGRGCADDGYSVYAALTALFALDQSGVDRPRAVGIIETCEETGSDDLSYWLTTLAPRCGHVAFVGVLDGSAGDYDRLWATTSFRGMVATTLRVDILKNGVHSGTASGIVPDSFTLMRQLLDRFEDSRTGEILDRSFHTVPPAARMEQLRQTADVLTNYYQRNFPWVDQSHSRHDSTFDNLLAQTWKPQLAVIGTDGLPSLQDAGNVLRPYTALRLSVRVPAHVDTQAALASMEQTLTQSPPYDARVRLTDSIASDGWDAKPEQPWFAQAFEEASMELFGQSAAYLADGASIPILNRFEEIFPCAQFLITGVLGPNSNAHGPNEMLRLDYVERLTQAIARIVSRVPSEKL